MARTAWIAAVGALLIGGVVGAQPAGGPGRGPPDGAVACPMYVEGTEVSFEETATGGALTLVNPERLDEVRANATAMVARHNARAAQRPGRGAMGPPLPPSMATAEEIPEGARIVFEPTDRADAPLLREELARRAEMMNRGMCPMRQPRQDG